MPRKSQVRIAAEAALSAAGVTPTEHAPVFVDRSASGHRVKFSWTRPGDADLRIIRRAFAELYPSHDTRVWIVAAPRYCGFGGIAFKVFNNE